MKSYEVLIKAYTDEIVCGTILNHTPNLKYWYTKMNKGDDDLVLRIK